jgi:hypothetical protein
MKNPNITKEGISVFAGQLWESLDKRECKRYVMVKSVSNGKATVIRWKPIGGIDGGRTTILSVSRMHKGSTGWTLYK